MSMDDLNWNCPKCGARYNHADTVQTCLQRHYVDTRDPLVLLPPERLSESDTAYHATTKRILNSIDETIEGRASSSGSRQTPMLSFRQIWAGFLPGEIIGFSRTTYKRSKSPGSRKSIASSLSYETAYSHPLSFHSAVSDIASAQDDLLLPSTMRGRVAIRTAEMPANHPEVFSSAWLNYLRQEGIILPPERELDWSGRGQHVEYQPSEEQEIPLKVEEVLGHSASALVESVMCRRIRLARKKIQCGKRLTKEDAINEVRHLQNCQHSHIVRVVGTYTISNQLAILLYPAARWNLEDFLDDTNDPLWGIVETGRHQSLTRFIACLSQTVSWLHDRNVRHMDIKPKNILIRQMHVGEFYYKVYLADFGIARAYQSAKDSETDSPTEYTPRYAAPEIVQQDTRGFSADIFSLGCVFMEIIAALLLQKENLKAARLNSNGNTSYHANIEAVRRWYAGIPVVEFQLRAQIENWKFPNREFLEALPTMIDEQPSLRPIASALAFYTQFDGCLSCSHGPEPFEAANSLSL